MGIREIIPTCTSHTLSATVAPNCSRALFSIHQEKTKMYLSHKYSLSITMVITHQMRNGYHRQQPVLRFIFHHHHLLNC